MDDDKVYYPLVIEDLPFPEGDVQPVASTQQTANDVFSPVKIKDQSPPLLKVAQELLSTALNTSSRKILQEFQLADSGALRIGKFVIGVSGEIVITPAGITAMDASGNTTFTLDGDNGNATFSGTIQGQSLVAGSLALGGNNIVLDGDGQRITMTDGDGNVRLLIGEAL